MPHFLAPMPAFEHKDRLRFWSWVDIKSHKDCWLWKGRRECRDPKHHAPRFGFGDRINQRSLTASRVAYYLHYREDPGDLLVCHSCDSQLCMNPYHLWLGTQKENMMDCSAKGRIATGNSAKLSEEQVREIRRLYHQEQLRSPNQLSKRFGVTPQQIWDIVVYNKWKEVV